ncbi:uncharacterized protein LOC106516444 [Austrofundulus limnaeus]|uniref:Uncharacterized protein LOC106516444 n=1 Tax=Austrofundulus limnaeus TaxID=52670 RepID=A0A2I4B3D8_AUSLI|nr:PREDICTED: uncharacterized protein LOC106516444 [Austrofundulus limnaeus]
MSGLGLLLFLSGSMCGSLLVKTAIYASTENNTSSGNLTRKPTTFPLVTEQSTPPSPTSKPIQTTTTSPWLNLTEYPREIIMFGALIAGCTFFLMTTFLLTCKVCRLSRRIRMLSRSAQLNSNSDFLEAKKDTSKSEGKDEEAAVLMSYATRANQELDSAATEQDGGEAEEKNESGSLTSKEALATAVSSQEEPAGSETTPAAAAATSSSEGTEEPQNQP